MKTPTLPLPFPQSAALLGTLALALGACTSDENQQSVEDVEVPEPQVPYDPEPERVQASAEQAELDDIQFPTHFSDRISVDPEWDTPPQAHDGVFLAPREQEGKLVFSAVGAEGTLLWTAERPLSCSGFAVTAADDRSLAVLTDRDERNETGESAGVTTATAYDLHTGEDVWGPVEVPGPHQGPGLVFAERPEESAEDTGRRVALDSTTGEPSDEDSHIVGEFFGTLVVTDGNELVASTDGQINELWRTTVPEHLTNEVTEELASPSTNRLPPGSALIGLPEQGDGVWDITEGELLEDDLDDAMFDLMSETWVGVREKELVGFDLNGEEVWSEELSAEAQLLGVGGVMAYVLTENDELRTYNTVTGSTTRLYDPLEEGTAAIPLAFTERGAAAVDTGTELFLVTDTSRPPEDYAEDDTSIDTDP
jgi:outer membrane protein assembly factor BamB